MWTCPKCFESNGDGAVYCGSCGNMRPTQENSSSGDGCGENGQGQNEEHVFCYNCGKRLKKSDVFCFNCGAGQEKITVNGEIKHSQKGNEGENGGGNAPHKGKTPKPPKKPNKRLRIVVGIIALIGVASAALIIIKTGGKQLELGGYEYSRAEIRQEAKNAGLSEKELKQCLAVYNRANTYVGEILQDMELEELESDSEYLDAADDIMDRMENCKDISSKSIDYDECAKCIEYEYSCGGKGIIGLTGFDDELEGTECCGMENREAVELQNMDLLYSLPELSTENCLSTVENRANPEGSFAPRVLMLRSYSSEDTANRETRLQSTVLTNSMELTRIDNADVDDFLDISGYDLVMIFMHGCSVNGESYLCISREYTSRKEMTARFGALERKGYIACFISNNDDGRVTRYYSICEGLVRSYDNNSLEGCGIMVSSCQFFGKDEYSPSPDTDFADAFINRGAEFVIGFHNSVMSNYGMDLYSYIIGAMNRGEAVRTALTDGTARYGNDDYGYRSGEYLFNPPAYPVLRGNRNYRFDIPITEPTPSPEPEPTPAVEPTPSPEPTPTQTVEKDYFQLYHDYVASKGYQMDLYNEGLGYLTENGGGGWYYIFDIDNNGIPELFMNGGSAISEAFVAVYGISADGTEICPILVRSWAMDLGISVNTSNGVVRMEEYHGGESYIMYYLIIDNALQGEWLEDNATAGPFTNVDINGIWEFSLR